VPFAISRGVRIQYNDLARGGPALLCLPGWCENKIDFARFTHAAGRAHRVIGLDWRGHGKSDASDGDFGLDELVEDALAVVRASSVGPILPVAVSHAGWVAIELRRRLGERVRGLVLLDWMLTEPTPAFRAVLEGLQDRERWLATRSELFRTWSPGPEETQVTRHVREEMGSYGFEMWSRAAREIAAAYARHRSPLEALKALDEPVPTLHLYSQPRDAATLEAQRAFARANDWFHVQRLDGTTHFPALELPDAVADAVLEFARAGQRRLGPFSTSG
jgi:pimeloyl-ACP methyl ester carboxylesterase